MALPPGPQPSARFEGARGSLHDITFTGWTEKIMHEHELAPTTHTVELRQIAEMSAALASGNRHLTAGSIGVEAAVPESAVLLSLDSEGPPSYPYIFGHFSVPGSEQVTRVELHTANLRAISDQLKLRSHIWGE
jgi:hypothetical protein